MQRLEVSGAVRPIYGSLGVERLRMRRFFLLKNCFLTHTAVFMCSTGVTLETSRAKKVLSFVIFYTVITRVTTVTLKIQNSTCWRLRQ